MMLQETLTVADSLAKASSHAMTIVERDDIPDLTSVMVDGKEHPLGLVKDFRKNALLAQFLPDVPERISFSWVRLSCGETLAVHSHPTPSLILVCEGEGYCTGDISGRLCAGSMVLVPANCLHGFCGAGDHGFWGLSIQLESLGLYENVLNPRVSFRKAKASAGEKLDLLVQAHNYFMDDFKNNYFFEFLHGDHVLDDQLLDGFLDNLQYFSTRFQGLLKARVDSAGCALEKNLALEHLDAEKDHDVNFAALRGDPALGSIPEKIAEISDWFETAMRERSSSEKIVLMHLVLEGSGQLAHSAVRQRVEHLPVVGHFALHEEEDEEHFEMGMRALSSMLDLDIERLLTTLISGWVKLNTLCENMAFAPSLTTTNRGN